MSFTITSQLTKMLCSTENRATHELEAGSTAVRSKQEFEVMFAQQVCDSLDLRSVSVQPMPEHEDPPDVLIRGLREGVVGAEVTRVVFNGAASQREHELENIVQQARTVYANEYGDADGVWVNISFERRFAPRGRDRETSATNLANAVAEAIASISDNEREFDHRPCSCPGVSRIFGIRGGHFFLWQCGESAHVRQNIAPFIESVIKKKKGRAERARQKVESGQVWLVIVSTWLGSSSTGELTSSDLARIYECEFDRLFFVWPLGVNELTLSKT